MSAFLAALLPAPLIEGCAFVLALGYVLLSIRQVHWAWPLMAASSTLYGLLFVAARLYGQALLQAAFVVIALWGWWQWRYGRRAAQPLAVARLGGRRAALLATAVALATVGIAAFLAHRTDAAAPWLDAFTAIASLAAQLLTARKYLEAWAAWLVINVVSVLLFAQQSLWLTAALYAIFALLSLAGWRRWRQALRAPAGEGGIG